MIILQHNEAVKIFYIKREKIFQMQNMKTIIKKIKGRVRLFWGFCPECNSDAPKMYDCKVCNWYQTGITGMPSINTRRYWWQMFLQSMEQRKIYEFVTGRNKPFYVDTVRTLLNSFDRGEISLSKLVEELNIYVWKWKHKKM